MLKGFSILSSTVLAGSTASVMLAALKPLSKISLWWHKWLYSSKINFACITFCSIRPRDTLTSASCISFYSCCETCLENHSLYLFEMKDLTGVFAVMSSGWNLFMRLCGTITTWHICFLHRSRITSLFCPLKVSMIIKDICSFGHLRLAFACFRYGNTTFSKSSIEFHIWPMVIGKGDIKISRKDKSRETSRRFPFVNELDWWFGRLWRLQWFVFYHLYL